MTEARRIRVRGQVQGVGFRPFVWQLARRLGLAGEVLNDPEGVLIHAAGAATALDAFTAALAQEAPPLARVTAVETAPHSFEAAPGAFVIAASRGQGAETRVTPDAATCPDCLAEIADPGARRHRHAFASCTQCGPRFSIVTGLPYDRARTTMADFPLCPACAAEYADPADRRFHAQPLACPDCGPRLWIEPASPGDPLAAAAALIRAGGIVAVKGLGGFHLACDATDEAAITRLRARKHRPVKPLALMADLATIRRHAAVSVAEAVLLGDPAAPIVLLDRAGDPLPEALAPGQHRLGWMVPSTPLHHLLFSAAGRPLVMTSGNPSGTPMLIDNDAARTGLAGIADAFLLHDRGIARRLDDSVERITPHGPMVLRRGRGRVPGVLPLPQGFEAAPRILAVGGQMKGAICLVKSGQALLGHHLGDLDEAECVAAFEQAVTDYAALFDHRPDYLACDLHPEFRSTRHAEAMGLPLIRVQHHHAHLAACLAENLWPLAAGPVAGIVLDGLGLGLDGTVWGGELLLGGYREAARITHLRPAPLPGGDMAGREPWRNLLARLDQAGLADLAGELLAGRPLAPLRAAMRTGLNAPASSSAGRLFDALAAAVGVAPGRQSFEGEAAMALEALAETAPGGAAPYPLPETADGIDPAPMFRAWAADRAAGVAPAVMAARAHAGIARAFAAPARRLVETGQAEAVALSGGCFQNGVLLGLVMDELAGLPVLRHTRTPANDGGLALGQAAVAAARVLAGDDPAPESC